MVDMEDTQAPMPLADFGNLLREERVRRGYTVDEVASQLKITSRMVRAIEDGDVSSMPHAVYARGFIRAYAKLLGMGEEEARLACRILTDKDEDCPQEHFTAPSRPGRRKKGGGLWFVILLCLLCAGGYWAYSAGLHVKLLQLMGGGGERATPALPATPAAPDSPSRGNSGGAPAAVLPAGQTGPDRPTGESRSIGAANASVQGLPDPAGSTVPPPSETSRAQPPAAPAASSSTDVVPSAEPASSAVADAGNGVESLTLQTGSGTGTPIAPEPAGKRHQIILTALAECWVHSSADDMDTRQLSIQKGETFALSFDRKLVVKLGNAGGVRIKYDGKELPPPGKAGQVKTLVFPQAATDFSSSARD